jgi:hypothetical protein
MIKRRLPTLLLLLAAALLSNQQCAQAQWWKSVLNAAGNQNNNQYQEPYGQPYGQYGQYGQQNQYQQQNNGNLSQVSDSMRNIERAADQLAKQSMYSPQGSDAALLLSLNTLRDGARAARRAADSNNMSDLMNRLSQMQVVSGNALTIAQRAGKDSYSIAQLQMIQAGINQASMIASSGPIVYGNNNNYNPYNRYNPYPNPYAMGVLAATGSGRGQFTLMGQALMGIKQATINCNDGRNATMSISQGGQTITLTGTLVSQTPNSATIAISGSDHGVANGTVSGVINNGRLSSANGNGMMNGQPFVISFQGN